MAGSKDELVLVSTQMGFRPTDNSALLRGIKPMTTGSLGSEPMQISPYQRVIRSTECGMVTVPMESPKTALFVGHLIENLPVPASRRPSAGIIGYHQSCLRN